MKLRNLCRNSGKSVDDDFEITSVGRDDAKHCKFCGIRSAQKVSRQTKDKSGLIISIIVCLNAKCLSSAKAETKTIQSKKTVAEKNSATVREVSPGKARRELSLLERLDLARRKK